MNNFCNPSTLKQPHRLPLQLINSVPARHIETRANPKLSLLHGALHPSLVGLADSLTASCAELTDTLPISVLT
ncbi:hypothetical protein Hanom_Chr03g00247821 [Helianthus anomalus]